MTTKTTTWTPAEMEILLQYERTSKSAYAIFRELTDSGRSRTLKAVIEKIYALGLRKPKKHANKDCTRIGYLDIEAGGLVADFAPMYSWAIKERDGGVESACISPLEITSSVQDKRVVGQLLQSLNCYDTVVTYYGTGFDLPFIRTRAEYHGLKFPAVGRVKHIDVYYIAKHKLSLHSKRLDSVSEFLGIAGKTRLKPRIWNDARHGDLKALDYILKHNIADVNVLERVHKRIEKYARPVLKTI